MNAIPGMNDPALIIMAIIAVLAGALIIAIWFVLQTGPFDADIGDPKHYRSEVLKKEPSVVFEKNFDLRLFSERNLFLVPRKELSAWFGGIVIALCLTALLSWTSQRDEAARVADAALRDTRLPQLLARLKCPPPAAPLEKLLVTIGTQADGKAPVIVCTYVTSSLGTVPQFRHQAARYALESRQ